MTYFYLIVMTICLLGGVTLLFSKQSKWQKAGVVVIVLGLGFFVASISQAQTDRQARAEAQSKASDDVTADDLEPIDDDASEASESESESIEAESIAESESVAESESIVTSQSIAASQSAASQAEADREAASESAAEASRQAANAYSDPRPAQAPTERHYDYAPVPNTAQSETVYVSAAIPGRYHKDPNCRGLQRYGGAQTMTLAQAQAQGYQAFCAYERYGSN